MIELLDLKIDVIFKDFFGDKSSKEILESFLNTVLGLEGEDRIEVEECIDPRKMRVEEGVAVGKCVDSPRFLNIKG
jgi:hypothetical protein